MARNSETLEKIEVDAFQFELRQNPDGAVIWRKSTRSGIPNTIGQYSRITADGSVIIEPMTVEKGREILQRIADGEYFSSAFLFADEGVEIPPDLLTSLRRKSDMDEKFTSTGAKFWKHPQSMQSYREGSGRSVISTHISPEGRCNLACPYCSVTSRQKANRLDMDVIRDYVEKLKSRGLKAVIFTGGGEPTLYPQINELLEYVLGQDLKAALITNGTQLHRVDTALLKRLTWMRVSVNLFDGWEEKIQVPDGVSDNTTLGMSFVYTPQHEGDATNIMDVLGRVKKLADRLKATYIRLLPNCLLEQNSLLKEHMALKNIIQQLGDSRFFHQGKVHEAPDSDVCHQSYFRPYLSEEPYPGTDRPGTVFPCDSLVLNQDMEHFGEKFALCPPGDILDYLDGKIPAKFDPRVNCTGCVFSDTVNMLNRFKNHGEERFSEYADKALQHVEFV